MSVIAGNMFGLPPARAAGPLGRVGWTALTAVAAVVVVAVLVWQALTAAGNPDPDAAGISHAAMVMDTGVLVFREGLEAILVLVAHHRQPGPLR